MGDFVEIANRRAFDRAAARSDYDQASQRRSKDPTAAAVRCA